MAAALVAASLMVASCASEGPPRGSVMVVVDTNVTPGRDFDTLRVRVEDDPLTEVSYHYGWDAAAQRATVVDGGYLPFTVNVQNARDGLAERSISVTAWKQGAPLFVRDARLVLPASGTKLLRMPVEALCFPQLATEAAKPVGRPERDWAVSCAEGQTCFGGICTSVHVNATKLEDYAPEAVFGGAKAPGEGGACVDVLACFTRRAKPRARCVLDSDCGAAHRCADNECVALDPSIEFDESKLAQVVEPTFNSGKCTLNVELLDGRDDLIIGVELRETLGSCAANGCVVLLDRVADPSRDVGWRAVGGRVSLPSSVCTNLLRVFVRVGPDAACPVKRPSVAACGEARSVGSGEASNRPESFVLEGGGQGAAMCAARTPSRELCAEKRDASGNVTQARVACGEVLVDDPLCAVPYYPALRFAQCRGVGETTACPSTDVSDMKRIAGGTFLMGSTEAEVEAVTAFADELPQHPVAVREFWLDTTEVTLDAYAACVAEGKCTAAEAYDPASDDYKSCNAGRPGAGRHPINCVDWFQANAYCAAQGKRLPTEEEWEYAARGGARQYAYPWGNEQPTGDTRLCWSGDTERSGTCAVGSFSPAGDSAEGVKDLAGNVYEWTASRYSESYRQFRIYPARVFRGGSWYLGVPSGVPSRARAAYRDTIDPKARETDLGFRCARSN